MEGGEEGEMVVIRNCHVEGLTVYEYMYFTGVWGNSLDYAQAQFGVSFGAASLADTLSGYHNTNCRALSHKDIIEHARASPSIAMKTF